jgi:diguanylate cyclase (GGDEF)-like protein
VAKSDDNETVPGDEEGLSSSVARGKRTEAVLTSLRGPGAGTLRVLQGSALVIGRSPDADFPIDDDLLSRRHARVMRIGSVYAIEDLGSTNGTHVDGVRVRKPIPLEDGARIHLGTRTVLHFRLHDRVELDVVQSTHALTLRDPLTGLFNRRHLEDRLRAELAFSKRHLSPLTLILLDVDHFKKINDRHGHPVGDAVLRTLATSLSELTRGEDVLARYGGEEFALLTRELDRQQTIQLAERIRAAAAEQTVAAEQGAVRFTVSLGVAHLNGGEQADAVTLIGAADRALYASKDAGRNSISIAPPSDATAEPITTLPPQSPATPAPRS